MAEECAGLAPDQCPAGVATREHPARFTFLNRHAPASEAGLLADGSSQIHPPSRLPALLAGITVATDDCSPSTVAGAATVLNPRCGSVHLVFPFHPFCRVQTSDNWEPLGLCLHGSRLQCQAAITPCQARFATSCQIPGPARRVALPR